MQERKAIAQYFGSLIASNVKHPAICGKRPFELVPNERGYKANVIVGCRSVTVLLDAGLRNRELSDALTKEILAKLVPWEVNEFPRAYIDPANPKYVSVDAMLPIDYQITKIRLDQMGDHPNDGSCFVAGQNMHGNTIVIPTRYIEHVLIAGTTGSGKSTLLQTIAYMLSLGNKFSTDGEHTINNQIILVTGKMSKAFADLRGILGQVGPIATDDEVHKALGWALAEVNRRYDILKTTGEVIATPALHVVFDEPQEFTENSRDPIVTDQFRELMVKSREVGAHVWAATHKATIKMFGPQGNAIRSLFGATFGLRTDETSSRVLRGDDMCTYLHGKGHMRVKAEIDDNMIDESVQAPYVPESLLSRRTGAKYLLDRYPDPDLSRLRHSKGRPPTIFSDKQLAASIYAAQQGYGRGKLKELLDENKCGTGTDNQRKLMAQGRRINRYLGNLTD